VLDSFCWYLSFVYENFSHFTIEHRLAVGALYNQNGCPVNLKHSVDGNVAAGAVYLTFYFEGWPTSVWSDASNSSSHEELLLKLKLAKGKAAFPTSFCSPFRFGAFSPMLESEGASESVVEGVPVIPFRELVEHCAPQLFAKLGHFDTPLPGGSLAMKDNQLASFEGLESLEVESVRAWHTGDAVNASQVAGGTEDEKGFSHGACEVGGASFEEAAFVLVGPCDDNGLVLLVFGDFWSGGRFAGGEYT